MPRHVAVKTLKGMCMLSVYQNIAEVVGTKFRSLRLKANHNRIDLKPVRNVIQSLPASLLNELILLISDVLNVPEYKIYFYYIVAHSNVKVFRVRNFNISLTHWEELFVNFANLVNLDLTLSCTDDLLQMIAKYCPNLEHLIATCRLERNLVGVNAASFTLSVTDKGLGYLCSCSKLKSLTINEPRSRTLNGMTTITYTGIQKLLRSIETLEDITYSDMGTVISRGMEDVAKLNLRHVRHFNATVESMREILRLCQKLVSLQLVFFNSHIMPDIFEILRQHNVQLESLEVSNYNFTLGLTHSFEMIGSNLVVLNMTTNQTASLAHLIEIGIHCPNLEYFSIDLEPIRGYRNFNRSVRNYNQFTKLINLTIMGKNIDIWKILPFCTMNAVNLLVLKITESGLPQNLDKLILNCVHLQKLTHLEILPKYEFTKQAILDIINEFPNLNYLSAYCPEHICDDIQTDLSERNLDLLYNNRTPFRDDDYFLNL